MKKMVLISLLALVLVASGGIKKSKATSDTVGNFCEAGPVDYMEFQQANPYPTFAPPPVLVSTTDPAEIAAFLNTSGLTAPNIKGEFIGLVYAGYGGNRVLAANLYYYASEPARPYRLYCGTGGVLRLTSVPPWFN